MTVLHGDCLELMPTLDVGSFDAIVTDPPYGLSFMGKSWDHGVPGVPFWEAALRVAKPGAHLVAFGGTRTYHRLTCAIEDAGWEIRDCLSWLYGSGFPKSHNGPWGGTALKPAWEPIILARKPLSGTVAANHEQHGTAGLNIDGCRLEGAPDPASWTAQRDPNVGHGHIGQKRKNIEAMNAGLIAPPSGRWPANVVLDEEAAALLDEQSGDVKGAVSNGRRGVQGIYRDGVGSAPQLPSYGDAGGASRFFFVSKGITCEKNGPNASGAGILCASCATASAPRVARADRSDAPLLAGLESTGSSPDSTPTPSPAPSAERQDSTGTTPTTPTFCASCGCALPAIDASTKPGSEERVAGVNVRVEGTRFWYSAKASRAERNAGLEGQGRKRDASRHAEQASMNGGDGNPYNRGAKPVLNHHPTVKPLDLMQWLCRLVTPKGGLILDPFCGSGTTGRAAVAEGFRFIGIEKEAEYVEIARARIAEYAPLFGGAA